MTSTELLPCSTTDPVRLAVAANLARYESWSRLHNESDLRCYLSWCVEHRLPPLQAQRAHVELFLRWLQEIRRLQSSTVARRLAIVAGFYRTCVLDGTVAHSPADYIRRPHVSTDSPTLGLTHLQSEALLSAAPSSTNHNDFALVCLLGLLGLRVFEATGATMANVGEEDGHRVLRVYGKGDTTALVPLPPAVGRSAACLRQGVRADCLPTGALRLSTNPWVSRCGAARAR